MNNRGGFGEGRGKQMFWMVPAVALVGLVAYNLYTGRTIEEIGLGSIGTVKFATPSSSPPPALPDSHNTTRATAALVPEQAAKAVDHDEMVRRQAELEAKLRRMEEALKRADERPTTRVSEETANTSMPAQVTVGLGGTWYDATGTSWVVHQNGTAVTFQEINPLLGVTAVGQGTLSGRQLQLVYQSAMQTTGQATLTVSSDGRSLNGNAHDFTTGVSFPLLLGR